MIIKGIGNNEYMKPTIKIFIIVMFFVLANDVSAESKDVTMQVGETQTLYLPSSVTSKNLRSVNFYSNGISYVQVVSHTNYSVKVKAIKAFSSPVIVRCDYYYLINNGGYTYQTSGYYDFNITVVGENDNKVKPTRITFPTSAVGIEVGESRQLIPTVYPADAEYTLTWSINDKSIATVSQDGLLIGKSEGAADLTVKADNGVYAMLRVVVSKPTPNSVSLKPSSLDLKVGDEKYLTASVYPLGANQTVTWASSNTSIATVSHNGKVTATGVGNCTITARTSNNRTAVCTVKVFPKEVLPTLISLRPEILKLEIGETSQLSSVILPNDATTTLSWSSSDNSIATVDNGLVTGVSDGICSIKVTTANGLSATSTVVVRAKEILPVSVSLSLESLTMTLGEETMLSASIYPENATAILTWTSSNPAIATVEDGKLSAINEGCCAITVSTQNGISASCDVTVKANDPVVDPASDWSGSYPMIAKVDYFQDGGYIYPEEFIMDIEKDTDGAFYITSFIGFNVTKTYPYTGLKLNVISNTQATIDLNYSNDVGSWTVDEGYTDGLHMLSANSKYNPSNFGTISLTRDRNNEIAVSDFYVYYFGQTSDYEYSQEAHYSDCTTVSEFTGRENIIHDRHVNDMIGIYSLTGRCIYIGDEENAPLLETGIYIKRKGNTAIKFVISK